MADTPSPSRDKAPEVAMPEPDSNRVIWVAGHTDDDMRTALAERDAADKCVYELSEALKRAQAEAAALRRELEELRAIPPDAREGREPQWISVDDERKPPGRTPILVAVAWIRHGEHEDGSPATAEGIDVTEGEYVPMHGDRGDYFESFMGAHGDSFGVTHWMPLPAAPVESIGPAGTSADGETQHG